MLKNFQVFLAEQKYLIEFLVNTYFKFEIMHVLRRNLNFFIFLFLISLNFNNYSYAHMRGTFSSAKDAKNKSLELGCQGIHKNKDKWLPCKNEKELHLYLRK